MPGELDAREERDTCDFLCLDMQTVEPVRASLPGVDTLAQEAGAVAALGDPTRLAIALALREEAACACDLAWIIGDERQFVSDHARALKVAGLARSHREGRKVVYELTERGRSLVAALGDGWGAR